ncbi:MAG: SGNH/GDSL hydrolase family protein [Clostridia bacterium]|nr:SGNH/GDSL hydrolase family protein [Clostridia bacterium]
MKFADIIRGKKEFTVGFLGGSITEGACASHPSKRYASRVVAMLNEAYPETKFTEANASVSGTGSNLGLFRAEHDLLSQKPDMVFIEFSVNDSAAFTAKYHEALIHFLRKYRADLPIVFLYTMAKYRFEEYAAGLLPTCAKEEEEVARYYGIPSVSVAGAMAKDMGSIERFGEYMWDMVHPIDKGYAVYAQAIMEALETAEFTFPAPMPAPLQPLVTEAPRMITVEDGLAFEGWRVSKATMCGRLPCYLYASAPGTSLHYEFDGKVIGLYLTKEKDSGRFAFSIDGGEWQERSTFDEYCPRFSRANYSILADDLAEGHHTLDLRILPDSDPDSEGTFIRFGAMLLG